MTKKQQEIMVRREKEQAEFQARLPMLVLELMAKLNTAPSDLKLKVIKVDGELGLFLQYGPEKQDFVSYKMTEVQDWEWECEFVNRVQ